MLLRVQHRQIIVMIMLGLLIGTIFPVSASASPFSSGGNTASVKKTKTPTIEGLYDSSPYLRGWSELGAKVTFQRSDGTSVEGTASWMDGEFTIYHPWTLNVGEQLALWAQFPGKTVSDTVYIPVLPSVQTSTPTVTGSVYANGGWLRGTTEPGISVRISLKNASGTIITSALTSTGSYEMQVEPPSPITAGEKLQLIAKAEGPGNRESDPVTVTVLPLQGGKTAAPTVAGGVYERSLKGHAEPESFVTIQRANGGKSYAMASRDDGAFAVNLNSDSYKLGEELKLTALTYGKTASDPVYAVVQPSPKSSLPTVSGNVYTNGGWINGSTEPNTRVFIQLKDADGVVFGEKWTTTGSYSIRYHLIGDIAPMQNLYLTAMADGKKESDPVLLTVLPTAGKTAVPTVIGHMDEEKRILNGKAEPGSAVKVKRLYDRHDLERGIASETDGSFSINLSWILLGAGDPLTVRAETPGKEMSDEVHLVVQPAP